MSDGSPLAHGDLRSMADSVAGTFPGCEDAPLARALLRQLALGRPVSATDLAAAAERDGCDVVATLRRWPNVERDDKARVVAFGGLSLRPTAHAFEVDGRGLHTWCAWDTLFLPALLGQSARVRSRCPITGAGVRLTVDPDKISSAEPATLAVSFPRPEAASPEDITGSFCCHVYFLAGAQAAERWRAGHQGAVLDLDDAFELGRIAIQQCL
jgi:alkylmercury lyase